MLFTLGLIGIGLILAAFGIGGTITVKTPWGFVIGGALGGVLVLFGFISGMIGFG